MMTAMGTAGTDPGKREPPAVVTGSADPVVTIRVPAETEYLAILRTACSQLAPRLGCTPAQTAELRTAVDEACGVVLRNCVGARGGEAPEGLTATFFAADGPSLLVTLELAAEVFIPPDSEEFGWTILTALVDDFTWCVTGSEVRVELRKLRKPGRWE